MANRIAQTIAVALCAGSCSCASAQITFQTVALTGDQLPSGAIDAEFASFETPVINESGVVAFKAIITGPDVIPSNDAGIWSGLPGSLEAVAVESEAAAGAGAGVVYGDLLTPTGLNLTLNDADQLGFIGELAGAGVTVLTRDALWVGKPTALSLLARGGDFAPGTADFSYLFLSVNPTLNVGGVAAFGSILTGDGVTSSNDAGLWSGSPGAVMLTAHEGDPAADAPIGQLYGNPTIQAISETNTVVFRGDLTGAGVTTANDSAIWTGVPGSLVIAAREGDAAPGTAVGVTFRSFGFLFPDINASNEIAIYGELTGPGIGTLNDRGIWTGTTGSLSPAIRAGDPVVGGLPGEIVTNFGAPVINKDGTVAVSAATFVSPSARSGIFVGTPGGLAPVALEGQSAPNLPASIAFGSLFSQAIALSNTGRVVFQSSLTGAGVSPANDVAIFAQDSSGSLVLVAREGDSFDVDDSAAVDLRVIESLLVQRGSGGTDGRSRGINDSNQLVFQAAFTDGSQGVFIATLIAPPCLADTNGDGFVTPADFSAWVAAFNTMAPQCDQNGDGLCTPADFSAWVANYNAGCP